MNMYDKIDMHTLSNLPTVMEIEVIKSIPTPFIPFWAKCLMAIAGVAIGILIYNLVTNYNEKKKRDEDDAKKNEANEYEKAQHLATISKQEEKLTGYGLKI